MKKTLRYKTYWLGVFGLFLGLGNPVLGAPISEDRLPRLKIIMWTHSVAMIRILVYLLNKRGNH